MYSLHAGKQVNITETLRHCFWGSVPPSFLLPTLTVVFQPKVCIHGVDWTPTGVLLHACLLLLPFSCVCILHTLPFSSIRAASISWCCRLLTVMVYLLWRSFPPLLVTNWLLASSRAIHFCSWLCGTFVLFWFSCCFNPSFSVALWMDAVWNVNSWQIPVRDICPGGNFSSSETV